MKKFVLFTLILSILASGIECLAQKKQAIQAIMGKGAIEVYKAIKTDPKKQLNLPGISNWGVIPVVPFGTYSPQAAIPKDTISLSINLADLSKKSHADLLQRHREAMLQKSKEKLKEVYRKQCAEMELGKPLRDTLAWIRLGNKAAELGLDSITADCVTRFLFYRPSTPKIAIAVDSLMSSSQPYARAIIEIDMEFKFCNFWGESDSTRIGISDFKLLAELGTKYMCYHTDLAWGTLRYFDCDYDGASSLFMRAADYAITSPDSMPNCRNLLFRVTAYCLSLAERYSEMLTFFEKYEELERYAEIDPYIAFLLYRACLFVDPGKGEKYADMGLAANEAYFMEQFQKLYDAIYASFIENPQPLTNLGFLFGGLDANQLSQSYIDFAGKLIGKLPESDTSYDGSEHYYDETLAPYREALLEIAKRSDSLQNGELTPNNALVKIIAESTRGNFLSSAEEGRANVKALFEQLYEKRDNPEYYITIVLSGFCYSEGLSYQNPKEALKVMNKAVLPIMQKLDAQDVNPYRGEETVEIYKYMASLYRRTDKPKKAEKMQKLADEYVIAVE